MKYLVHFEILNANRMIRDIIPCWKRGTIFGFKTKCVILPEQHYGSEDDIRKSNGCWMADIALADYHLFDITRLIQLLFFVTLVLLLAPATVAAHIKTNTIFF